MSPNSESLTPNHDWVEILRAETKRTSITEVARRLGYSRPAISQVLNGCYGADAGRIETTVREILIDQIKLPSGVCLTRTAFDALRTAPMPTSNPKDLRLWIEVQDHSQRGAA